MGYALQLDEYRNKKAVEKSFIDFISAISKNESKDLLKEFKEIITTSNVIELQNWFSKKSYNLSIDECQKILTNSESLQNFNKETSLTY